MLKFNCKYKAVIYLHLNLKIIPNNKNNFVYNSFKNSK